MIRVVLDTNVIISALLQPLGPPSQIFVLAIGGSTPLCVSGNIYAEYEEVVRRPRFRRDEGLLGQAAETVRACSDPGDDIFLECANAVRADYLVTGNLKDFPMAWTGTRIVSPRRLLSILAGETEEGTL